jgi:hypothetical protein
MNLEFERWLLAMDACKEDECSILALNWRIDPHLSRESKAALGKANESNTDHPRSALKEIPDNLWFHSSNACNCDASTLLSRITHVERFEKISGFIVTKEMDVDDFLPDPTWTGLIRGSGQICWSSPSDKISKIEGDSLRDRMGLAAMALETRPDHNKRNWLVEIQFPASLVPAAPTSHDSSQCFFRPTCVEAGDYPPFLPSNAGSQSGHTQDLSTGDPAVPEFVHQPIKANKALLARRRGKLTKNPSTDWISRRLALP